MVQHQLLKSVGGVGGSQTVVVATDPVPLTHGKSGEAILAATLHSFNMPRGHGHEGIVVPHLCFDGAMHSYLNTRLRQYHLQRAIARAPTQVQRGLDIEELMLREWVVDTQCIAHVCHNALKWAKSSVFDDSSESLKNLWGSLLR